MQRTTTGGAPVAKGPTTKETKPPVMTSHQKSMLGSGFDSSADRRRNSLLTTGMPTVSAEVEIPKPPPPPKFDGKVPDELQDRDLWKAVQAPVQSQQAHRTKALYTRVVQQFGIRENPRYADDGPGKIRGHIFVWDVSRAMGCEIPHFLGAKELTLAQTCDWVRHEGPMRGWKRALDGEAVMRANEGKMVVALPREQRIKFIAIVVPQAPPTDGSPRLMGIGLRREAAAHPRDLFGSKPIDCYYHD